MKCSKPFIVAYNELFNFISEQGYDHLVEFWGLLEEAICQRLKYLAETEGFIGMMKYWGEVLAAEGAIFEITYSCIDTECLVIQIYECPSIRKLKEESGQRICPDYCGHCQEMYPKALSGLGYSFRIIGLDKGCLIRIEKV